MVLMVQKLLVSLLLLYKFCWTEFNKAPGGQTNYSQCRVQELITCPQPPSLCKCIRHPTVDVREQKWIFPVANKISYLGAYPNKLFTLYTP